MTNNLADELEGFISDIEAGVVNHISAETLRRVARELRNPWKPIESAPEKEEILFIYGSQIFIGMKRIIPLSCVEYEMWYGSNDANNDVNLRCPDYWMPLPEPPEVKK